MTALNWQRKKPIKTRDEILARAIHKLIIIKKRRIEDGRPTKEVVRVQKEIDKLQKMRRDYNNAAKFAEWRTYHAKSR